ncbi:hypothetical protein IMY05_002G0052800 [Salix suchowensis]|nr:hypothetical protein IMY05_002G0052800 [Salix suchowensis]
MLSLQILQGHQTELGQAREFLAKGVLRREACLSMKDIHILQKTAVPKKKVSEGKKQMTIDLTPFRDQGIEDLVQAVTRQSHWVVRSFSVVE